MNNRKGVAFFPSAKQLSANPYWPILASELEKAGVRFCHETPSVFDLKWLLENRNQIRIINLHFIQQFYKSSTFLRKIVKLFLFAFNMLAARALGYRTVFTLHNLEPTYPMQPAWLDYLGHWIAANLSGRVIVYCNEARRLLTKRYGRSKGVFFVDHPNVVDYYPNTVSTESARSQLDLPLNSIVFAFIGGIRPNKGVEMLIQAFLNLQNNNYRLIIAGSIFPPASYAHSLQEVAANDNRISFHLKYIPDNEVQIYMNAADIVVLPFARILTSGTANLAMSFSRPVIVPRMGCLQELVESDFGWLFESDSVDSLSATMQNAIRDDYLRIGQNAFKKISAFSPERFAIQTIKAYWE